MRYSDCETSCKAPKAPMAKKSHSTVSASYRRNIYSQFLIMWAADFVGVKLGASIDDITKAYKKKARTWHPDKAKQQFIASKKVPPKPKAGSKKKPGVHVSKGPSEKEVNRAYKEATDRFTRLRLVTEILRGPSRERYDHFLENGFPKWRGTGYYYARFRPGLGSVLFGLFVFAGGLAHYGALILGWRRQKDFVERYIRQAKRAAWGDDVGIAGLPGLDGIPATASVPVPAAQDDDLQQMNRRQKRLQERENKKESKKPKASRHQNGVDTPGTGTSTPKEIEAAGPQGAKKRVQAENGKVLLVDSVGNVWLEEESKSGEVQEFLLDPDEIPRPTFRQTALFRLPLWVYSTIRKRLPGGAEPEEEADSDSDDGQDTPPSSDEAEKPLVPAERLKAAIEKQARNRARKSGKGR